MNLPSNQLLVEQIVAHSGKDNWDYGQRGQMIVDAMLPGAGHLTVLSHIKANEVSAVIRAYAPADKIRFLQRIRFFELGDRQKYQKDVRAMLDDADKQVRLEAALWMYVNGSNKEKVAEVFRRDFTQDLAFDWVQRIFVHVKSKGDTDPLLIAKLAERINEFSAIEDRVWILGATGASDEAVVKAVEHYLDPAQTPSRDHRWSVLRVLESGNWGVRAVPVLRRMTRDPDRGIRVDAGSKLLKHLQSGQVLEADRTPAYLDAIRVATEEHRPSPKSLSSELKAESHRRAVAAVLEDPVIFESLRAPRA